MELNRNSNSAVVGFFADVNSAAIDYPAFIRLPPLVLGTLQQKHYSLTSQKQLMGAPNLDVHFSSRSRTRTQHTIFNIFPRSLVQVPRQARAGARARQLDRAPPPEDAARIVAAGRDVAVLETLELLPNENLCGLDDLGAARAFSRVLTNERSA